MDMDELRTLAEAHRLIPLQSGAKGKQPRDKGYSGRDYTFDEIAENIATGNNVGMMIGKGEVDVDLDWPEAQLIWPMLISENRSLQWGRHGRITQRRRRARNDGRARSDDLAVAHLVERRTVPRHDPALGAS
jgi:hypothetical protein